MKTDCNYEPPNVPCKNLQGKLLPKLLAFSTSTFPTVQTHVKLSNLRDLRPATLKQKIPRPPNAFMLFANDFRRKLAGEFPKESNKDISVRLGCMWKNMEKDTKERYFQIAKEVDAAHKRKYPGHHMCLCSWSQGLLLGSTVVLLVVVVEAVAGIEYVISFFHQKLFSCMNAFCIFFTA